MKKTLLAITLVTTLAGCTTAPPKWVDTSTDRQFPTPKYLTATGCAKTDQDAQKTALAALAQRLSVTVHSSTDRTVVDINGTVGSTGEYNTRTSTQAELDGVFYPKTWHSNNETCVLAVINKSEAWRDSSLDLEEAKRQLKNLNFNYRNKLKRLRTALLEQQIVKREEAAVKTMQMLNPALTKRTNTKVFEAENKKALRIIQESTVDVESNDQNLAETVIQQLQAEGFKVVNRNPTFVVTAKLDTNYTGNALWNFMYLNYRVKMTFQDTQNGDIYKNGEARDSIQGSAAYVMIPEMHEQLRNGFVKRFCDSLLE